MKKISVMLIIISLILSVLGSCTSTKVKVEAPKVIVEDILYDDDDENPKDDPEILYETSTEVLEIESFDGYMLKGRLTLPKGAKDVSKLVIYVNGSGANTYLNRRKGFNMFDSFNSRFANLGVAFFSYSTRGVELGNEPPMYFELNEEDYQKYLPLTQTEDIYCMINVLKENERLKNCEVYLLGASEGTIIAPLVAEKYPDTVDGLLLWGYVNINMKDVLIWQNSGGPSMVWYRGHFEADDQGRISKEAYEADPNNVIASVLGNISFEDIDNNADGYLVEEDFIELWQTITGYTLDDLLSAIESRDDEWLRNNYGSSNGVSIIPLTSAWFLEHFTLRPNMEVLPTLDLPIYIFHGTLDQNCDVREVYKINEKFKELGKTNLTINVFAGHDHSLNYDQLISHNKMPDGIQAIFDTVAEINIGKEK